MKESKSIFRLSFLLVAGLAVLISVSCHGRKAQTAALQSRNANVILITLDTTRADHLSCYHKLPNLSHMTGYAKTPNLDALAARGALFEHDTSQIPLTIPSHACIMTGSYPEVNGVRGMGGFVLAKTHPTIALITHAAGYATAAFVGSGVLDRRFGFYHGFTTYNDNMGKGIVQGGLPGVFPEVRASVVTDRAIAWLKANDNTRFFLWCHYYDAHAPYEPPEPYHHVYAHDLYSGEIAYVDSQLGRLFNFLKEQGLQDRTLIVVTADHGESLGQHGELTHGVFLYDATLHVPLIIAGPGVPAGKVIAEQVRSIDIMPTILAFLHLSPGSQAQGVSLWPLMQKGRLVRSNYSYLETLYPRRYMGWSELRGIRTNKWKFILAPHPELYNLQDDPNETTNLVAREPVMAYRLETRLWSIIGKRRQNETVVSSPMGTQTRQELDSLGYVNGGTPRVIHLGTKAPDPKDEVGMLKILAKVEHLMDRRDYARSAQLMAAGLKQDPTNPLGMIYLAASYEGMGEYGQAIQVYEKAAKMNMLTEQILSRLGRDYLRTHQLRKAAKVMEQASELNPTDLDNLRNLGTADLQLGRLEDARKAFEAITLQSKNYAPAFNGLGLVDIAQGNAEGAMQNFQQALVANPEEAEPMLNLGLLYQRAGQKGQALHYFQMFLQKAPRDKYGNLFPQVRQAIQQLRSGA